MKKAKHYFELAAIHGNMDARQTIGVMEGRADNHFRATKHYLIAARAGFKLSLDMVQHAYSCAPSIEDQEASGFMFAYVTKEEVENTLREYQRSQDEMKSEARDKALAFYRREF